jgi:lambda family phage portal protein
VRDQTLQDGHLRGALGTERDTVVGSLFKLVATPDLDLLGVIDSRFNAAWVERFTRETEALFRVYAESSDYPAVDARREMTLTELTRLAVSSTFIEGEATSPVLWRDRRDATPFRTCVRNISPSRISNPYGRANTDTLTNGIARNAMGVAQGFYVRRNHPESRTALQGSFQWDYLPARKPWGRLQFIHIYQADMAEQTRAVSDLTAAVVGSRANKQLRDVQLQKAIVSASYVAAIISDLPPEKVYELMGASKRTESNTSSAYQNALVEHLQLMKAFFGENGVAIDGVKVPILPQGSRIESSPLGGDFLDSEGLYKAHQRMIASSIGHVYEGFSNDYSQSTYQSLKAAEAKVRRTQAAKKRFVAERYASANYALFLEEAVALGLARLPDGVDRSVFYQPFVKEALCACMWLGGAPGQVEELKETQAAALRMSNGLSSLQQECAKLGYDWREIAKNRAEVQKVLEAANLNTEFNAEKPSAKKAKKPDARDASDQSD